MSTQEHVNFSFSFQTESMPKLPTIQSRNANPPTLTAEQSSSSFMNDFCLQACKRNQCTCLPGNPEPAWRSSGGCAQPVPSTPACTSGAWAPATVCHHTLHTPTLCRAAPAASDTLHPRWELLTRLTLDAILQRLLLHLFKALSHIWAQAGKELS